MLEHQPFLFAMYWANESSKAAFESHFAQRMRIVSFTVDRWLLAIPFQ